MLPVVLGVLDSWLDTLVVRAEIFPGIVGSGVILVELSVFVNPEGSRLSRQSAVQPPGIPGPARAPLRM